MKVIKPATTTISLAILLTMVASSIIAAISSGATISAFAQHSATDFERPDLPQIPENPKYHNAKI